MCEILSPALLQVFSLVHKFNIEEVLCYTFSAQLGKKCNHTQNHHECVIRDEFARNSVGVSTGNSPVHPARPQEPPSLR